MSKIRLVQYERGLAETWDTFIQDSVNGTLFHRQKFIGYHPAGRFEDCSLLFYDGNELLAVFPGALVQTENEKVLKSHPGTSYGGFVFAKKVSLKKMFETLECLHAFCREKSVVRIEFRSSERFFYQTALDQVEFALVHQGYERKEQELSTFFQLNDFEYHADFEKFLMQFPQKNRNEIRKGFKEGLCLRKLETVKERASFHKILSESLRERYNRAPSHTFAEMEKILELFPEECFVMGILKNDTLASGFLVMKLNRMGWHIFYAPVNYAYQSWRPLNYGAARLIQFAMENNARHLNYGVSTPGGHSVNWGLLQFKENFNGTGAIRTYWVKHLTE